ncbi:hypothetical protein HID58_069548, partial [Brassica napus]
SSLTLMFFGQENQSRIPHPLTASRCRFSFHTPYETLRVKSSCLIHSIPPPPPLRWCGLCINRCGSSLSYSQSYHANNFCRAVLLLQEELLNPREASMKKHEACDDKYTNKDDTKTPEPPKDYIHVSHRLAERVLLPSENRFVRREKISEMLTLLQDLVPGSSRITGKAVSLDEIINYVQSLERQVELLYMKLATINPKMESNRNAALSIKVKENMLYAIACSEQRLPLGYYSLAQKMPRFSDTQFLSNYGFVQTKIGYWKNDIQSIVHMGFGNVQQQSNNNS